jgi:DNA helicase-4
MKEKLRPILEETASRVTLATIHSFCNSLLRNEGMAFEIISGKDQLKFVRKTMQKAKINDFPTGMVVREISLAKSNVISADEFRALYEGDLSMQKVADIYAAYEREKKIKGFLDFDDLLIEALKLLQERPEVMERYRGTFRHILVDEFQDTNPAQMEILRLLIADGNGGSFWICGDDWQSIYRFTGSDVRWTTEFFARFGPGTTTALDQTFRFNSQIGRVASTFVGKNPQQIKKQIASRVVVEQPAVSLVATAEPHRGLMAILARINGWAKARAKLLSVFVLGRYRYEVEQIQEELPAGWRQQMSGLSSVEFRTVHGSKGLEADFVILVGLESGRSGFPADKGCDWFEEMILPKLEDYPFAEERRLFYVALTRARQRVYLIFDRYTCSPFVTELESGEYEVDKAEFQTEFIQSAVGPQPCPRCATGKVIPRSGQDGKAFYGCNRYPACKYRDRGCGSCGAPLQVSGEYRLCTNPSCDGVHLGCPRCAAPMLSRTSQYGPFYGCSNFGRVDVTEQCLGKSPWRQLPTAAELRRGTGPSGARA